MTHHTLDVARRETVAAVLLALGMWATRSHHFGSFLHLPDASWAAFFIAGVTGTRIRVPLWLTINAGIIDYLALIGGVSSYCVTPAYVFLIPTYLTLWASGRWAATTFAWNMASVVKVTGAMCMGVIGAFVISNASFYVLAGYFEHMSALQFAKGVSVYLPRFLEGTAIYTAVAGALAYVAKGRSSSAARV